jgi:DNA processing protein
LKSVMRMCQEELLWLELALTPEVPPRSLNALLQHYGDLESIFTAGLLELGSAGLGPSAAAALANRAGRERAEREAEVLERHGIALITYSSKKYPALLRQISDPPFVLFALGEPVESDFTPVAVVGSRGATAYGTQVAHRIAGDLAARGVTIVSGMARGIDQAAHHGALEAGGRTIAVLGSGMGNIYPQHSEKLVGRISSSGVVLTEFSFDVHPDKGTFPQRNRIISGMSYCTVVVEASEQSGALITARYTLEQNRELLAVPGPISSRQSIGTNYMIKRGAKLVQRADDIIDELPAEVRNKLKPPPEKAPAVDLTEVENRILSILSVDTPQHVDIIAGHLGKSPAEISAVLLGLEMKSLVKQLPGMEFVKAFK